MKKIIFAVILLLLASIYMPASAQQESDLDCAAALNKVKDGAILVDVRTDEEFNQGHIENALHIPVDQIERRYEEISKDKSKDIVLYCKSGKRSGIAKTALEKLGYVNLYNAGGYTSLLECWPKTN
jgi:phage shock protein E